MSCAFFTLARAVSSVNGGARDMIPGFGELDSPSNNTEYRKMQPSAGFEGAFICPTSKQLF